jgi:hypothetical protein
MPDAIRQNNLLFLAPYNPQEPPELLFKRCTDCQEIAILAKVPYTSEQMMMNVIDLLTRSGMFVRDLEDWDRNPAQTKHGLTSARSSKKHTSDASHWAR